VNANEGAFVSDDLGEYTFEDSDDWDKPRSFFALIEFEGWSFIYLENWIGLNYMQKNKRDRKD
jgi:hypothetical protein